MKRRYRYLYDRESNSTIIKVLSPFMEKRQEQPQDKLFLAILEQTFCEILEYIYAPPKQLEEDYLWLFTDNPFPSSRASFISFLDICTNFGLNPNYVRGLVLREIEERGIKQCSQLQTISKA